MRSPEQMGGFEPPEEIKGPEKEQTPEEIESLVREAAEKKLICDLVIENSDGPTPVPDCLIEEMEGKNLMITYIAADGGLGELIPVNLNRIKGIGLKELYQEKE